MKSRSLSSSIILVLFIFILSIACACQQQVTSPGTTPTKPATETVEPVTLKLSYAMQKDAGTAQSFEWLAEELTKQSNGLVTVETYPAASLATLQESYDKVKAKIADISFITTATYGVQFPLSTVGNICGYGFPTTIKGHVDGANAYMTLYDKFPEMRNEIKDVKILYSLISGGMTVISNKRITVPDDMKGIKMGATGGTIVDLVNNVGGATVPVPPPEYYQSLKTGLIDSAFANYSMVKNYKAWEVVKYGLNYSMTQTVFVVIMNQDSWNALSADIQDLIVNNLVPVAIEMSSELSIADHQNGIKSAADNGMEIVELTSKERALWDDAAKKLADKWIADREKEGRSVAKEVFKTFSQLCAQSWK